jgi:hypothetical protein
MDPLEPVYNAFGMVGGNTPGRRFAGVLAASSAAEYAVKPSYAYDKSGNMRPNAWLDSTAPNASYLPAFAIPLILGTLSATFI